MFYVNHVVDGLAFPPLVPVVAANVAVLVLLPTHFFFHFLYSTDTAALMQTALVSSIPTFLGHTEARLVSYDISPTGTINAIFKDNRNVCKQ